MEQARALLSCVAQTEQCKKKVQKLRTHCHNLGEPMEELQYACS